VMPDYTVVHVNLIFCFLLNVVNMYAVQNVMHTVNFSFCL
jgi:hypothetical protein